jgi:mannose-1-phosphate guanylyltransferase
VTLPDEFHDVVAVLMAGGGGVRFWPLSTPERPKQFLTALTDRSLYVQAVDRARRLVPYSRILVMTGATYAPLVRQQTPRVAEGNVILEPCRRDTAAALILAALVTERWFPGAVMVATPSDHLVMDLEGYARTVALAVRRARAGGLVTIGIRPTFPATGYGYLKVARLPDGPEAVPVEAFVEKPKQDVAEVYLASGRYLWNAGIFVWRAAALLAEAEKHLPQVFGPLSAVWEAIGTEGFPSRVREAFDAITPISIDYGVMEKADDVWVVPAAFDWSDVGTWSAITDLLPPDARGNQVRGPVVMEGAEGDVVITDGETPVIVAGLSECVVVRGPGGVLVCAKDQLDRLKDLVARVCGEK